MRQRTTSQRQRTRRWWKRSLLAGLALVLVWQFGCVGPVKDLFPPAAGEPRKTVQVIRHGWHTGVAVRRADVPPGALPVTRDFPKADYVEFGWGDDAYYRTPRPTKGMALKAALWPTPSVLHVTGFQGTPRATFPASDIVEVELSAQGWERLAGFIDKTFARDADGRLLPLEKGLYGDSRFYRARGKFYFPKMCNRRTASALRAAGCPITRGYALTAGNVMWQTRRFGHTVPFDAPAATPETPRSQDNITRDKDD
ncbi:MAG: DUF2459 domain-containing protein [Verrucomicrobia bacterium]|nr:DUF2459 domain-containing protein [Verrucomicrobiota bacterium]